MLDVGDLMGTGMSLSLGCRLEIDYILIPLDHITTVHAHALCIDMIQIQMYQNEINHGGHPTALVSMVTTL